MSPKYLTGLCAVIAVVCLAPAVASAQTSSSNITCAPDASGRGVALEDFAIGRVECVSFTESSYSVALDLRLQYLDSGGQWYDAHICHHAAGTATATDGVAVVTEPLMCSYLFAPSFEGIPHRAYVVVTESLDSDVRTAASDPWTNNVAD